MLTETAAEANLRALFSAKAVSAKAVTRGGVVRRCALWADDQRVDDQIGRERLMAEVRRRDFHMIRCGGRYVVICNSGFLEVLC